jgi:hypothetical protein
MVPKKVGGGQSPVWGSGNGEHETKMEDTRHSVPARRQCPLTT